MSGSEHIPWLKKGVQCEAFDRGFWYKAKIIKVDRHKEKLIAYVHFNTFSKGQNNWVTLDNLRPLANSDSFEDTKDNDSELNLSNTPVPMEHDLSSQLIEQQKRRKTFQLSRFGLTDFRNDFIINLPSTLASILIRDRKRVFSESYSCFVNPTVTVSELLLRYMSSVEDGNGNFNSSSSSNHATTDVVNGDGNGESVQPVVGTKRKRASRKHASSSSSSSSVADKIMFVDQVEAKFNTYCFGFLLYEPEIRLMKDLVAAARGSCDSDSGGDVNQLVPSRMVDSSLLLRYLVWSNSVGRGDDGEEVKWLCQFMVANAESLFSYVNEAR